MNKILLLTALFLLLASALVAAPPPTTHCAVDGFDPTTLTKIQIAQRDAQIRKATRNGDLRLKMGPTVYQEGQIVIMEDDGSILPDPNVFDLQGREMQLLRRPKGMSAVRVILGFKELIGDKLAIGDDDSVLINFPANFRYPFGDEVYDHVWVNSDGNLTFGEADFASSERSLGRMLNGPPRLSPLFTDLDPSAAIGEAGVYVNFLSGRVRITWLDVPNFGATNRNSVQVTLFETGRAIFSYGDTVETIEAVVGASAFGGEDVHVIDYDQELPFRPPQRIALAEVFSNVVGQQDTVIANAFYDHYRDIYDQLVVFLDFPIQLDGAFAYSAPVQNSIEGFGRAIFDFSDSYGSDGELNTFVQMGAFNRYPEDPNEPIVNLGEFSSLDLLGHELGHRWLSFAFFIDQNGQFSTDLLGRANAHWSFFLDTEGSFMEGNQIRDNGDGTFTTLEGAVQYSALDQYLMGLRSAASVPDMFLVRNPVSSRSADTAPESGLTFEGTREDVTIDQIIAANGPRNPSFATSEKSSRVAFILVTDGGPPREGSIAKLETFREAWPAFFSDATGGRGEMKTGLFPK